VRWFPELIPRVTHDNVPFILFTAQDRRMFKLTMPLKSGQELLLESFVGHEGLSMEFGFQLDLLSDDAPFA